MAYSRSSSELSLEDVQYRGHWDEAQPNPTDLDPIQGEWRLVNWTTCSLSDAIERFETHRKEALDHQAYLRCPYILQGEGDELLERYEAALRRTRKTLVEGGFTGRHPPVLPAICTDTDPWGPVAVHHETCTHRTTYLIRSIGDTITRIEVWRHRTAPPFYGADALDIGPEPGRDEFEAIQAFERCVQRLPNQSRT